MTLARLRKASHRPTEIIADLRWPIKHHRRLKHLIICHKRKHFLVVEVGQIVLRLHRLCLRGLKLQKNLLLSHHSIYKLMFWQTLQLFLLGCLLLTRFCFPSFGFCFCSFWIFVLSCSHNSRKLSSFFTWQSLWWILYLFRRREKRSLGSPVGDRFSLSSCADKGEMLANEFSIVKSSLRWRRPVHSQIFPWINLFQNTNSCGRFRTSKASDRFL